MLLGLSPALPWGLSASSGAARLLGSEPAGLAIDFRDMSMVVRDPGTPANDFSGNPNAKLTYASPSTKWIRNASGVFTSGTTLRTEYDASGNPLGIRVEGARTNLFLQSNNFSTSWTVSGVAITAAAGTSPTGQTNAVRMQMGTGTASYRSSQVITTTAAAHTFSVFAKAGTASFLRILIDGTTSGTLAAFYNLSTGATATVTAGVTATITSVGNGWYLCTATATMTAAANRIYFQVTNADNEASSVGTSTETIFLYNAQLEVGSFPSSPIETVGSTVSRVADQPNEATADFPFSTTAGSVAINGRTAAGSGTQVFWQVDDGTTNERIRIVRDSSNNVRCIVTDGGVEQANINLGTVANNTSFRVGLAWSANDIAACLNGGSVSTDTSATLPTVNTLRIGYSSVGEQCDGHVASLVQAPRRVSNADLPNFGA